MKTLIKFTIISLIGILVLSACTTASPATPDAAQQTAQFVALETQAMQAAQAALTQEALANPTEIPTEIPTNTPLPTNTMEPPTATPLPPTQIPTQVPTATFIPATATPTVVPTRSDYVCQVVSSAPAANTSFPIGGDFDGRWTLKNTGTETWSKSAIDFAYISGTKFQTRFDVIDLAADVSKGNTTELIIDMLAPKTAGSYQGIWALRQGSITFCYVSVNIVVK
jgi:type II secretory pathway pseudopilin PulG